MKIKFLQHGAPYGFGYFKGDTADIPAEVAAKLIAAKVLASADDDAGDQVCELPEDMPHRDELEKAGVLSLDALEAYADDYTKIKGIGKAKATDITDFLNAE